MHDEEANTAHELAGFLQHLIEHGYLEEPERLLARQVIRHGMGSLDWEQARCFELNVLSEYIIENCCQCGMTISYPEMFSALIHQGKCEICRGDELGHEG